MTNSTPANATTNAPSAVENPKWTAAEIDRYLFLLAGVAAESLAERWVDFCAAARRQGAEAKEISENWESMLSRGPEQIARALVNTTEGARALRRIAPMHAVVPRERREELLRSATLSGSCGDVYRERWQSDLAEMNFVDGLVEHLLANVDGELRESFTEFVVASGQVRWIIAGDFVIADHSRPNDVFGFTVTPYDASFEDLETEIKTVFPKDLKETKVITQAMIDYLRSKRRFHFAFVVNKDRRLFKSVGEARTTIDQTIAMMLNYRDVDRHREAIAKIRALRQLANANPFNVKLFQDIILMAAFGGFVATLLQLEGRAELIGLFPDRDKMTTAYGTVAYEAFAADASAFAGRRKVPDAQIALALPGPRAGGSSGLYFDELIRVPDYVAGAIAGTEFKPPRPSSVNQKCVDIVAKALVDNANAAVLKVDLPPRTLLASRIAVQSTPPAGPQAGSETNEETSMSNKMAPEDGERDVEMEG